MRWAFTAGQRLMHSSATDDRMSSAVLTCFVVRFG